MYLIIQVEYLVLLGKVELIPVSGSVGVIQSWFILLFHQFVELFMKPDHCERVKFAIFQ
jgi:hypothetical protein